MATLDETLRRRVANLATARFEREDLHVCLPLDGFGLSQGHVKVLQMEESERLLDSETVDRLVELGRAVDVIQRDSDTYTNFVDGSFLSDVFAGIVERLQFTPTHGSPAEREHYEQAQNQLYDSDGMERADYLEFKQLRSTMAQTRLDLLEARRRIEDATDDATRQVAELEASQLEELFNAATEAVEAMDRLGDYEAAEAVIDQFEASTDRLPPSVLRALDSMELSETTDSTNVVHLAPTFFPAQLNNGGWVSVTIGGDELSSLPGGDGESDQVIDEAEVELQTLLVERNWFWPELFDREDWHWTSPYHPVAVGPGSPEAHQALIPGYVYGLVFARRLRVTMSARPRDNSTAAPTTPDLSVLSKNLRAVLADAEVPILTSWAPGKAAVLRQSKRPGHFDIAASTIVAAKPRKQAAPVLTMAKARPSRRRGVPSTVVRRSISGVKLTSTVPRPAAAHEPRRPALERFNRRAKGLVASVLLPISGKVADDDGNPIAGAMVELEGQPPRLARSDRDGAFSFPSQKAGVYSVSVKASGYKPKTGTVKAGTTTTIRLEPMGPAAVEILIDGQGKDWNAPIDVLIESNEGTTKTTVRVGQARRMPVEAEQVTIRPLSTAAISFRPAEQVVRTEPGSTNQIRFDADIVDGVFVEDPFLLAFIVRMVPPCPTDS